MAITSFSPRYLQIGPKDNMTTKREILGLHQLLIWETFTTK